MAKRKTDNVFDFDDVMLIPRKGVLDSRSQADTTVELGGRVFNSPAIPANMSTIIDEKLAVELAENNFFYVMHRFDVDPLEFTKRMYEKGLYSSVSFGIKEKDFDDINRFVSEGIYPSYITVDVAHGHTQKVIELISQLKEKLPLSFVIAGNVGSIEGAVELEEAGADAIKVGISPGCFTPEMKVKTEKGYIKIKDISVGDKVLAHSGKFQKVLNKFEYDHHEEIITVNGIECTPEHEFYVCDKKDEHRLYEGNYRYYCHWVEAHELDESKHFLVRITHADKMNIKIVPVEKSIIESYSGKTYDLEVAEDHSYNIGGIIVHNSACLTGPNTGFGTRGYQLSAVEEIAYAVKSAKIIADGGVRHFGDVAKAVALGADMVMIGGMFSGHDENPGNIIENEKGEKFKEFFGSASEFQKGEKKHVEGKKILSPYKGSIFSTFNELREHLQSSVSYAGGKELLDLRSVEYVILNSN